MEQMQPTTNMPHIVQVYPSVTSSKMQNPQLIQLSHPLTTSHEGKVTYQQTITSESITIPVSEMEQSQRMQSHIMMSCHQTHLQNLQPVTMQSQVLQTDLTQPLQFTSHMILPGSLPHMLIDGTQPFYGQYSYVKESFVAKTESEQSNAEKQIEREPETPPVQTPAVVHSEPRPRKRRNAPDRNSWACNVRKMKHQSGEAYISRRGKYVPERQIRNHKNCLTSCKMKCNKKICDSDRELIFKAFYSLKGNEKKHFLLNTTERNEVKRKQTEDKPKRQYAFKYFFLVRGSRHAVCKDFYLGTLAISQKPVYNVHAGKSEMNIPKPDGRGLSVSSIHSLPADLKDSVRKHISNFKTRDGSPVTQFSRKKQHLDQSYNVKQMYVLYLSDCQTKNISPVKQSMYRKILKEEFNIHLAQDRKTDRLCVKCREPIKKK